jgi:hypothetical protein
MLYELRVYKMLQFKNVHIIMLLILKLEQEHC